MATFANNEVLLRGQYNLLFGMHFVNTPNHAQGPMSTKIWKDYVHKQVGKMDKYNPMMQAHTGWLTRDLTPFIKRLQRQSIPVNLPISPPGNAKSSTMPPRAPRR